MSKVLLVYEDYSEMTHIESVLKKVGFDVLSISNEFTLAQQVLAFNPDIIVGYGKGPKVSTVGVGRRIKEMPRWLGKAVLIFPGGVKPDPMDLARIRMDMALEAPLEINRLLQVLANLTDQNPTDLIERMMKAVAQETQNPLRVSGGVAPDKKDDTVFVTGTRESVEAWQVKGSREVDEFNRLMGLTPPAEEKPEDSVISPVRRQLEEAQTKIADKMKGYAKYLQEVLPGSKGHLRTEMRKAQKKLMQEWSEEELKTQDQLRREATKALFKKKD
ncbi:MAG: hypothetical protein KF802_14295 [Bdellovibrionaceae bacterium]|nr:hypothetical protein [Pseudobdellovibrionaceae bacterium]MBX3033204.1 hypothetical protein [Pseudobdellovibrionaceae bacterium]